MGDEAARIGLVAVLQNRPALAEAVSHNIVARRLVEHFEETADTEDVLARSEAIGGEIGALQARGAGATDVERLRHRAEGSDQARGVGGGDAERMDDPAGIEPHHPPDRGSGRSAAGHAGSLPAAKMDRRVDCVVDPRTDLEADGEGRNDLSDRPAFDLAGCDQGRQERGAEVGARRQIVSSQSRTWAVTPLASAALRASVVLVEPTMWQGPPPLTRVTIAIALPEAGWRVPATLERFLPGRNRRGFR